MVGRKSGGGFDCFDCCWRCGGCCFVVVVIVVVVVVAFSSVFPYSWVDPVVVDSLVVSWGDC